METEGWSSAIAVRLGIISTVSVSTKTTWERSGSAGSARQESSFPSPTKTSSLSQPRRRRLSFELPTSNPLNPTSPTTLPLSLSPQLNLSLSLPRPCSEEGRTEELPSSDSELLDSSPPPPTPQQLPPSQAPLLTRPSLLLASTRSDLELPRLVPLAARRGNQVESSRLPSSETSIQPTTTFSTSPLLPRDIWAANFLSEELPTLGREADLDRSVDSLSPLPPKPRSSSTVSKPLLESLPLQDPPPPSTTTLPALLAPDLSRLINVRRLIPLPPSTVRIDRLRLRGRLCSEVKELRRERERFRSRRWRRSLTEEERGTERGE